MSSIRVQHFNCLVCNGQAARPLYQDTLLRCSSCGFITANLEVTRESLVPLYSKNYFFGEEYSNYCQDKYFIQKNFQTRLKYLLKKMPDRTFSRVLELGCAYGFWGELITRQYPKSEYLGFDISADAVEFARTQLHLKVSSENFLEAPLPQTFSDVFLWDVIEHLDRPDLYLRKINSACAPGAKLYLTTGDIGALFPRLQKHRWRMIHPPSHLHYFARSTLRALLDRCGFRLLDISYPSISRSVRQIFYSLFILKKKTSPFGNWVYRNIPEQMAVKINTFDIVFAIAEKIV
jgi:SAM-dependent methyltransferase